MSATQEQIHRGERNAFIERSFRDTADRDFICARLCHRHGLIEQFLWASHQAVEKYLKAILLFHDQDTGKLNHDLQAALRQAQQIEALGLVISEPCLEFLNYLDSQGPNRYFIFPRFTRGKELLSLDALVWQIRRFCDDYFFPHDHPLLVERNTRRLAFVTSAKCLANPATLRLDKGDFLDQVLDTDKHPALRVGLTWKNLYFGRRQKKVVKVRLGSMWSQPNNFMCPNLREWIDQHVRINPEVREMMNQKFRTKPSTATN